MYQVCEGRDELHVEVGAEALGVDLRNPLGAETVSKLSRALIEQVVLVVRGGGSLEDLQAFNSEIVAPKMFWVTKCGLKGLRPS